MRISKAWIVASKDLKIFLRKKNVLYSVVFIPLLLSIGLPMLIHFVSARRGGDLATYLPILLNAFSFLFIVFAAYLPIAIAAYSLVGEKVEKSLEPLLATPITDGELLMGKSIASFIPTASAIYLAAIIFMVLMDLFTHPALGYYYFPNWNIGIILLLAVPLAAIFSVEISVIISSRVSDVRAAQGFGAFAVLPLGAIYVASEIGAFPLDTRNLLIITAAILLVDVVLFFLSTRTFQREEILTKWK